MRRLHHFPLSPFCRKVCLVLGEKKLGFESVPEKPWEPRADLVPFDPSGQLPVLIEDGAVRLSDAQTIVEYLEEVHPDPPLLPRRPTERAEARRLAAWFDRFFFAEVTSVLVREKVLKRHLRDGPVEPDPAALRRMLDALRGHLAFVERLLGERDALAGVQGLADFTAVAHLSCADYFGDVPWSSFPGTREWYARLKSRPSFRPLLTGTLPGFPPAAHYANLDF